MSADGWWTVTTMAAAPAAAMQASFLGFRERGLPPVAAATHVVSGMTAVLARTAGRSLAADGAALLMHPDAVRLHVGDGWADAVDVSTARLAVTHDHPRAGQPGVEVVPTDRLAPLAARALVATVRPIVEAGSRLARVGRPGLWNEVADAFGLSLAHQLDVPPSDVAHDRLRAALRTRHAPWNRVPTLTTAPATFGPVTVGHRGGCCLAHSAPSSLPRDERMCSTCSLRDRCDSRDRQVHYLEAVAVRRDGH